MSTNTTPTFTTCTETNCQRHLCNKQICLRHDSYKKKKRVPNVATITINVLANWACLNYSRHMNLCFHDRNEAFWFERSNECRWVGRLPDPHNENGGVPDPHNECKWGGRLPDPRNERGSLPDPNMQTNMSEFQMSKQIAWLTQWKRQLAWLKHTYRKLVPDQKSTILNCRNPVTNLFLMKENSMSHHRWATDSCTWIERTSSIGWRLFRCGKFVIISDSVDPELSLSYPCCLSGFTKVFHPYISVSSSLFFFSIIVFLFL